LYEVLLVPEANGSCDMTLPLLPSRVGQDPAETALRGLPAVKAKRAEFAAAVPLEAGANGRPLPPSGLVALVYMLPVDTERESRDGTGVQLMRMPVDATWVPLTRCDAALRPLHPALAPAAPVSLSPGGRALRFGDLRIDPDAGTAQRDGALLPLTAHQHAILWALASRAGRTLSRAQIAELVDLGLDDALDRAVDVQISRIRALIEAEPRQPRHLLTVRGVGYRFSPGDGEPGGG
jgi:hypothetical protein